MADAAAPLVPKDGTITVSDGAGTPLTVEVKYEDGNLSIDDLAAGNWEIQKFEDRGTPYALRATTKKEVKVSFTCHAVNLTGANSVLEAIRKTGTWAAATSTLPIASGGSEVHCVQVSWAGERSDFGATADAAVVLKKCRLVGSLKEGTPGELSFQGSAYVFSDTDVAIT